MQIRSAVPALGLLLLATQNLYAELPIGAAAARASGADLPLPFGISYYRMEQEQPFDIKKLAVTAGGNPVQGATVRKVENKDETDNLRFDVWLFPFLDVYLLGAKTKSEGKGTATAFGSTFAFEQDFESDTLGLGVTAVYGYKELFASLDINYSESDVDISDKDAKATIYNTRFGWNGQRGSFKGAFWLGTMYQDLKQTLEIETTFMGIPVTAEVEEEPEEPLNYVVGGRWILDPHFDLSLEWGFGKERDHWMAGASYRF